MALQGLTLLLTANLRGDLALLPRLYSFLKMLRAEFAPSGAASPPMLQDPLLLLDLGAACDPAVWHCAATQGRSTLLALDAMGYTAAHVPDTLPPDARAVLARQVALRLVDAGQPADLHGVRLVSQPDVLPPLSDVALSVVLTPQPQIQLNLQPPMLLLADVPRGHVGLLRVVWAAGVPRLALAQTRVLPPDTFPDATIAGTISFIEEEARWVLKQQGRHE